MSYYPLTIEEQYLSILWELLYSGDTHIREGRNGSVRTLFGRTLRHDLSTGFPLLTTKRVHFKSVAVELLWFLRGDTNIKFLHEHGVTIWDEWADEGGNLGPVYGSQWRSWQVPGFYAGDTMVEGGTIDQIANVVKSLQEDPYSRRHVVSAWNPAEVDEMALPPCHCLFQFQVIRDKLNCHLFQRSADWFLGVPFNIASYALLIHLMAEEVGLQPGELMMSFTDVHLYSNHKDQAETQLQREPRALPKFGYVEKRRLDEWGYDDLVISGYDPHSRIEAEVSK